MVEREVKIKKLKEYFEKRDDVVMAYLFGSQAEGRAHKNSDWDIAVYIKPIVYGELEVKREFPQQSRIWEDVERLTETSADLLVLNRARPSLVFSILNSAMPLTVKDRALYLRLLVKTHYEAVDFWNFVYDFWKIRERSRSLSAEDRATLIEHLVFFENEWKDLGEFKKMEWNTYTSEQDRSARRNIERWVENLVMVALDIAKIILASEGRDVPQTYKETLRAMGGLYLDASAADEFASFADLRNLLAHEYLDYRWEHIRTFILNAEKIYPRIMESVKEQIKS
jgi:predicted nucleotidyltransferase/uncharacterized protein YutE (UPF0331/DUF86 family)